MDLTQTVLSNFQLPPLHPYSLSQVPFLSHFRTLILKQITIVTYTYIIPNLQFIFVVCIYMASELTTLHWTAHKIYSSERIFLLLTAAISYL